MNRFFFSLRKMIREMIKKRRLEEMDLWWYLMFGDSIGGYPPSFYHTHTEEEIEEIMKRDAEELREMIASLPDGAEEDAEHGGAKKK